MKVEKLHSTCLLMFLLLSSSLAVAVSAWSNGGFSQDPSNPDYGTHDWIAEHALDWLPEEEKQYLLGSITTYLYGTELPDNGQAEDGIGDTFLHHVYFNSSGALVDDSAATRAVTTYHQSLGYLRSGNLAMAAKYAGVMSHYVSDMAVFGHVMGVDTDWGSEEHHSDYESYVNERTSSYDAEFNIFLSFDGQLDIISAYDAALNLAYDTTFDVDGNLTCVWMDQNYDWNNPTFRNRAGESLNLAVNYVADVLHTLYVESSASSPPIGNEHVLINEFEQNPPGTDAGYEWVELLNPTSTIVDIGGWTLSTTHGVTVTLMIPSGTTIGPYECQVYSYSEQWLDNEDESIILRNAAGNIVDETPISNDGYDDDRAWARYPNGLDTDSAHDWGFQTATPGYSNGVEATLIRTPHEVYSGQAALIFTHVRGVFSEINLSTTVSLNLLKDGSSLPGFPITIPIELPMISIPWSPGWYLVTMPCLPAKTFEGLVYAWKVSTIVSYGLLVDGVEVASDNYAVKEGEAEPRFPPLVVTSVYDVIEDRGLVKENFGLGPRGWKIGANEALKTLIVTVDDVGIQNVTFEYSVNDGSWKGVTPTKDPLMGPVEELISKLNNAIDVVNSLLPPEYHLLGIPFSIKIYNAQIPGQSAGHYVMFRGNATDVDGNQATSPSGFYFVVNEVSNVRVLIVDPHVKLWLLQENVKQLLKALKDHSSYQVPSSIIGNMTIVNKIADITDKYGIEPFHHWETLGKHYDLYIAWPDETLVDLLRNEAEGGFEPNVIYLSNLWLGFNGTGKVGPWNWDLRDIEVDGKPVLAHLIDYVKQRHAGFIASHGTLSDWVVWLSCNPSQHYKVGARGHVGDTLEDFNLIDEKTVAALLGMPELALWEYGRDKIAEYLCQASEAATDPEVKAALKAVALMVGSLPLQVSYVPFNGTMRLTDEAKYVGWDVPEEFTVTIPSVYNEFGFNAYTQVGWQLAMPRALAYTAWWKVNETRPLVEQLYAKLSKLVENATSRIMSHENTTKLTDKALEWGMGELYRSIINASIMGNAFNITLSVPDLNETLRLAVDIGREAYEELLRLLPVKLVALSNEGLSAIIVHDKYWDLNGYRSVYFGFEVEATEEDIAEKLLTQAVNWTLQWSFKNITELLGNLVRVPKDLAESFNAKMSALPGSITYSDGVVLVEEGNTTVTVNASKAGFLHLLIAHPTSGKVNLTAVEGAEVYQTVNVTEGLTCITLKAYEAGTVKLSIKADPETSLNPAYLSVKQEADTTPPSIGTPFQDPPEDNIEPDQAVTVSVNVTDAESGVREVVLSYSTDDGATWTNVTMSKADGNTYVGQILGLPAKTDVQYKIIAYDNAGNFAVNDKAGEYWVYTVIPEFPTWPLLLFTLILLAAVIILVKKRPWTKRKLEPYRMGKGGFY